MNDELKLVCEKLDNLTVEYIEEADAISKLKETIGKEIAKGFFDLGHSKYTMGTSKLSRYSYDERMKSIYKIQVREQDNDSDDLFSISHVEFKDDGDAEESNQTKDDVKEQLSNMSLRQRKPAQDAVDKRESEKENENGTAEKSNSITKSSAKKKKETRKVDRNPLHWFGVLVPSSLRTSQQHFKTVITQIMEEANHMNRLSVLEERYKALQKEKERILLELSDSAQQGTKSDADRDLHVDSFSYESEDNDERYNELDQVVPEIETSDTA